MPGDTTFESFEKELNRLVESFGNRITIEDKPEVRKAGGVYYTPRYIVDYIVEQAAGKLLDDIAGSATVPVAASGVAPDASETQIDLSDERVRRDAEHRARDARAPLKDFEQKPPPCACWIPPLVPAPSSSAPSSACVHTGRNA